MLPLRLRAFLSCVLLLSSLPHAAALAAWPHDPTVNVPVCVQLDFQQAPQTCSDGDGGVVIAWQDRRNLAHFDIYAQRLSHGGTARWTAHGVPLCTEGSAQSSPLMTTDGAGGAIVTWSDSRGVYAQRVDSSGAVRWTANGVAIGTGTGSQTAPAICPDGFGGAYIAWQDQRSGNYDIYVQRVSAAGAVYWTANGIALCTATDDQTGPCICADGTGAVVAWTDYRNGSNDIYAQRVTEKGGAEWTANGNPVSVGTGAQRLPRIVSDGSGGTLVAWEDSRSGNYDIYATHLNAGGSKDWGAEDALCSASGGQQQVEAVSDGAGGVIVSWTDYRTGAESDIYAQCYRAGVVQWTANGVALCTATGSQVRLSSASDGAGGAIVSWADNRAGSLDIYAQRVTALGTTQWASGGLAVCTAEAQADAPSVAEDGEGGAVIVFMDLRNDGLPDLYAQRVHHFGALGNPEPAIVSVDDLPYDQGGQVVVEWTASWLDADPLFGINSYAVWRQVPSGLVVAALAHGARLTATDEATASLDASLAAGRRVFRSSPQGAQATYWEYVGATPATGFPGYSYVAPTTCDSMPEVNPLTDFMVQARSGSYHYDSEPEAGYSVDNLAPAMPAPFTGTYAEGTVTLAWGQSTAADFAEYRLHRGPGADFVPGAGNLVATLTGTGYVDDPGAPCWYKLCAVDVHGNASPYAVLLPAGTADVPPGGVAEVSLAAAPNPAREGCAVRFALPRAARISLAVFDQQGRRVRTLAAGGETAGEHVLAWDARDDGGRVLPSGLYFLRLEVEGRALVRRVAVLR